MNNTEIQVRTAVANYFTRISQRLYSESPALLAIEKEGMRRDLESTLDELTQEGELSQREATKLSLTIYESLSKVYSPEKRVQEVADFWVKGGDFYRSQFGKIFDVLGDEGEATREMKEVYDSLLQYAKRRDNIVDSLIARAQSEGMDTVTSDEAIKSAVKQEFPTEEDYTSSFKGMASTATKIMNVLKTLDRRAGGGLDPDRVIGNLVAKTMDAYQDTIIKADVKELYQN